jgi:hypothetical protein
MQKLNLDKRHLRKFGVTMAVAIMVIATIVFFFKHKNIFPKASLIAAVFLIPAFTAPAVLRPVYIVWMKLAFILGWVNARLILCVIFYLVFTPAAIILKLLRKDLLDKRIEKGRPSYWQKKEGVLFNRLDYERQY